MKPRTPQSRIAFLALALIGILAAVAHAQADEKEPKDDFDLAEFMGLKTTLSSEDVSRIYDEKGLAGLQELDIYLSRTLEIKHTRDNEESFKTDEKIEVKTSEDQNSILIPRKTKLAITAYRDEGWRKILVVNFDKDVAGSELVFISFQGTQNFGVASVPQKEGYKTSTHTTLVRSGLGAPRILKDSESVVVLRVMKHQSHEVTKTKRKAKGGK